MINFSFSCFSHHPAEKLFINKTNKKKTLEFVFLLSDKSLQKCFGKAENKTHPACDSVIVLLNRREYFSAECLAAIIRKRPRLLNAFHPNKEAGFVSAQQKIGFQSVRLVVGGNSIIYLNFVRRRPSQRVLNCAAGEEKPMLI